MIEFEHPPLIVAVASICTVLLALPKLLEGCARVWDWVRARLYSLSIKGPYVEQDPVLLKRHISNAHLLLRARAEGISVPENLKELEEDEIEALRREVFRKVRERLQLRAQSNKNPIPK